jgi:hypothetical protein
MDNYGLDDDELWIANTGAAEHLLAAYKGAENVRRAEEHH